MKKVVLLMLLVFSTGMLSYGAVDNKYFIDDSKVDQAFSNAIEASAFSLNDMTATSALTSTLPASDREAAIALLLDFFLGGFGVHRFYLGTEVMTGVGYILTCGGIFGIVPLVDFIVLIIDIDDISKYIDNPRFFMWM